MMEHTQHLAGEAGMAAAKVAPPVTAAGLTLMGVQLSDWLIIATLIYTLLQIALLLQKLWQDRRARRCQKCKK